MPANDLGWRRRLFGNDAIPSMGKALVRKGRSGMSKKSKTGESLEPLGDAVPSDQSIGIVPREMAPMASITIEIDAEFAEELIRMTGMASLDDAAPFALRAGIGVLQAYSFSTQKKAVDALFKATKDDFRRTMKLNSPGR